ncbi:GntR family transcriptional regulator [Alteribacter populi]|uniref:GntR family transcriptional regulator n=1 Tax=Alteribacter populi TaxID=2011011 RepID=UPI000BBB48BC|nr:GntR family transcriptional regulator [Alteribacter populi]
MKIVKDNELGKLSIRDYVYLSLKERILSLELEPNTKISEKEIAEALEVSRTPVREAFLKLSEEGLLEIVPQSGTTVSKIDLYLVEEGRFVREKLETAIVSEACVSFSMPFFVQLESNLTLQEISIKKDYTRMFELDEEFHKILFYGCGKTRTWEITQQMNTQFKRLRILRLLSTELDWDIIVLQHREIHRLISNGRAKEAEKVMKEHLQLVDFEKETLLKQYPHYFKKLSLHNHLT